MKMKDIFKSIFFGLAVLFCAACTNEWEESCDGQALREGEVSLQWLPANMGIKHVKTRGTDPKTAEEQEIHNVHVFIFKQDGSYLRATDSDAFQGYRYLDGSQNLVLQTNMFESGAENAIVVAVANVGQDVFGNMTGEGHPENVPNLAALHDFKYELPSITATLPANGLPMLGEANANLASGTTEKVTLIQLKSLMARIDLDFTMDPYQSSDDRRNPALRIDEVRVVNFPKGCTLSPQLASDTDTETKDIQLQGETVVEGLDDFIGRILRVGEPQELTLYMFEHGRAAKDYTYPEGIDESERQRYKNKLADEKAAYIEMEGVYTNHNGYKYAVTYVLYPGANAIDDFTIKSNCQYKNNISVKGITVNNEGDEALLDTRVNIDTDKNPYFIEMLREREFDSHFNVTPMDVYIYKPGGKVTVEIVEPENHKWIRMEPMKYSPTTKGSKACADEAGEGKRKYFETNLVQGSDGSDGLLSKEYNETYDVVSPETSTTTHEERIYFYIDENVPTNAHRDGQNVASREATVKVTYYAPDGRIWPREFVVRQAGMRAVYFNKYSYGGGEYGNVGRAPYYFYIEEYEEYLEHYDGKNKYNDTYEGFRWGLKGLSSGLGAWSSFYQYFSWGWFNTMQIMDKYRANRNLWRGHEMTLNDEPSGAAEYCYNKNKRDANGNVVEARWYLPTISELEYALERYYGDFDVFQDKWYWSSNPGAAGTSGDNGENPDYARATRIKYEPDNIEANGAGYVHYMSNPDWPYPDKGGHASRDEKLRIRAAYIYKVPDDAPKVGE